MKVRFLGAQYFQTGSKVHTKIIYSADNNQENTKLDLDDGAASLSFTGEKSFEIKCDEEAYKQARLCESGKFCQLTLSALPNNPSKNICAGISPIQQGLK